MEYAIIVAGGSGSRMGRDTPKQFLEVAGLPILMHTIKQFYRYSPQIQILLVLPDDQLNTWEQLCNTHQFQIPVKTVPGGKSRFQSVRNGLDAIATADGLVAIHDGVRPFVPVSVIRKSFEVAREKGNAIAAVALKDSIRQVNVKGLTQSADRSQFRLIQTPQTFQLHLIKQAFLQPESMAFTDDATVAEANGNVIHLIEGDYRNIKITTPDDLYYAESLVMFVQKEEMVKK